MQILIIKFISFLVYLTVLNNNYFLFTVKDANLKTSMTNNTLPKFSYNTSIQNNSNTKPSYLNRKSKFCHIKCNCFFSHSTVNDNIYVKNWIKYF